MQASSVENEGTWIKTELVRGGNHNPPPHRYHRQLRGAADPQHLVYMEHAMDFSTTVFWQSYQKSSARRWSQEDTMMQHARAPTPATNNVGELNILSDLADGHLSWEGNFCDCLDLSYHCAIQITRIVQRDE
jgi:hypothetical protein